jgi:hypothetical protein
MLDHPYGDWPAPVPRDLAQRERLAFVGRRPRAVSERGKDRAWAKVIIADASWTYAEAMAVGAARWGASSYVRSNPKFGGRTIGSIDEPWWGRSDRPTSRGWGPYRASVSLDELKRILTPAQRESHCAQLERNLAFLPGQREPQVPRVTTPLPPGLDSGL